MANPTSQQPPLLVMEGIVKRFPGVMALDGVDFTVRAGQIHALMGQNGAGKSTLLKVLTGVYPRDGGQVTFEGRPIDPRSPLAAQNAGISTVYQEVNLIPHLSVAENIVLGRQPRGWGGIRWRRANAQAEAAMARLGLKIDVGQSLNSYSIAIQQMVAIARALDINCRLLVLDEPTSSLDADEVTRLFDLMKRLKAEGLAIVFVTHFLDQVYDVADTMTVLRNGKLVGEYPTAALDKTGLIAAMLGKDPKEIEAAAALPAPAAGAAAPSEQMLEVKGLAKRKVLEPLDMEIGGGEVLGLGGLLGAGRTETARLLFGLDKPDSGTVTLNGKPVRLGDPRRTIRAGMGFCSEDRKLEGIIPDLSVRENIIVVLQAKKGLWRKVSAKEQQTLATHYIEALGISTPDAEKPVKDLSGGNQQKVLLARWLAAQPKLLILDEPTRGIDVGAKGEIEALVDRMSRQGMSVMFISSELEEVVRSSHRVLVLADRKKVGELRGAQVSEAGILAEIAAAEGATKAKIATQTESEASHA